MSVNINLQLVGHALRNYLCLVESAGTTTGFGQRYRYNRVNAIKETCLLQLSYGKASHPLAKLVMMVIFELMNDVSSYIASGVAQKSSGTLEGGMTIDESHGPATLPFVLVFPWQVENTRRTKPLLIMSQWLPATCTEAGKKEVQKTTRKYASLHFFPDLL